jgi:hypothetical protein
MRINLKTYGPQQELYVDGVLVLAGEEMGAQEALEAISDFSKNVEFSAIDLRPAGTIRLFDDRFFVKGVGRIPREIAE